jgi:hypothetical protein
MNTKEFEEMIAYDFSNLDLQQERNDNCYGGGCDRCNDCNCKCDNSCICDQCK